MFYVALWLSLAAVAPAWADGQTTIEDYDTARDDYFWPRLYDRAPPGSTTVYCEVSIAERSRINELVE